MARTSQSRGAVKDGNITRWWRILYKRKTGRRNCPPTRSALAAHRTPIDSSIDVSISVSDASMSRYPGALRSTARNLRVRATEFVHGDHPSSGVPAPRAKPFERSAKWVFIWIICASIEVRMLFSPALKCSSAGPTLGFHPSGKRPRYHRKSFAQPNHWAKARRARRLNQRHRSEDRWAKAEHRWQSLAASIACNAHESHPGTTWDAHHCARCAGLVKEASTIPP